MSTNESATPAAPAAPVPASNKLPESREVLIYEFEVYDPIDDSLKKSRRWGTSEAINNTTHGRIIGEGVSVDRSVVEAPKTDIDGLTEPDFDPKAIADEAETDSDSLGLDDDFSDLRAVREYSEGNNQ